MKYSVPVISARCGGFVYGFKSLSNFRIKLSDFIGNPSHETYAHNDTQIHRQDIHQNHRCGDVDNNAIRKLSTKASIIITKRKFESIIILPENNSSLNITELSHQQSYNNDNFFMSTKIGQYRQLANSATPKFANALAKSAQIYLHKYNFSQIKKESSSNDVLSLNKIENKEKHTQMNLFESEKNTIRRAKMTYKFIDLFSGIGGFRLAFESLDCKCVFSSEIDKYAIETYKENFGEYPSGDITKIPSNEIPDFDILCAGFPCQPFSIGGLRLGFEDSRGTLFFEVARIIKEKKPSAFILENVKGLVNHNQGKTLEVIESILDEIGYNFSYKIMNALDYGIPQNRERWYCIGFKKELGITFADSSDNHIRVFNFPEPEKLDFFVEDVLDKEVKGYNCTRNATNNINFHLTSYKEKTNQNSNRVIIANEIRPSRCSFKNNGIVPCFTAKMGTGGNNVPVIVEYNRKLTERECLRLMGFPENFRIKPNFHQSYKQIGNSVVVPVITKLAKRIIEVLNNI